jgi:predicted enzyme related to lactoylglutathione lyase
MTFEQNPKRLAVALGIIVPLVFAAMAPVASAAPAPDVSVGPQYDSTHVYVAPRDLDAFIKSFTATFGGSPSQPLTTNVLPEPSSTVFQSVTTPVGTLSVFAFQTPVPFPFGAERTGYLVTDMDKAIAAARASGAEIIVAPFKDAIGRDAVIAWPGGVTTQLYWHFTAPSYAPLASVPDNRVYVSPDRADAFVGDFLRFSHGKIVSDDRHADAGEIGRPGEFYRRIRIESGFGKMQVLVTDGHLPYPFGREVMGYQVNDLAATLAKAKAAGAGVLSQAYDAGDRRTAVVQFPGGYIAEVHALKTP